VLLNSSAIVQYCSKKCCQIVSIMALLCSGAAIFCNPRLATLPSTVVLVCTFSQNLGSMIEEDGLAYMLIFCIAIFHVAKRFRRECVLDLLFFHNFSS
jgi:hypothetical protein